MEENTNTTGNIETKYNYNSKPIFYEKFEYLYEKTKIDPMVWNKRGLEGWEMVQIDWNHLDIIWKRRIVE